MHAISITSRLNPMSNGLAVTVEIKTSVRRIID
jgi:hypothetical protein